MTTLYLIRHARSTWNAEGRMQGWADPPLDDVGYRQAQALAERLKDEAFHAIYSSPLARARQTAEAIAAYHNLPICFDERLRERNLGEWTGLTGSEADERFPDVQSNGDWRIDGPPGGESQTELTARAAAAFAAILAAHPDERVAVVSHGGTLSALMAHLFKTPIGSPVHFAADNTSIARVRAKDGHVHLLGWGDDRHLQAMRDL